MDEERYREAYQALNTVPCPFEKMILSRRCGCEQLRRINIAEREAAGCLQAEAQHHCALLLKHLRNNARFALKITRVSGPLPHAQEIKVQGGGLKGLQASLDPDISANDGIDNVFAMVESALQRHGSIENFPYQDFISFIVHYEGRRKRRPKK